MNGYKALALAVITQAIHDAKKLPKEPHSCPTCFLMDLENTLWGEMLEGIVSFNKLRKWATIYGKHSCK